MEKLYPNVVAETRRGDPNHMVLLGAHLDSVPAGPGVNDDGSGTSFQLELAEQLAKAGTPPRNKIRFLWFGGEEDGLVGSQYYAAHLSDAEVARTDMMLDTDMIASPNFARLVYDGDGSTFGSELAGPAGSGTIERVLTDYWSERGMVSEPIPFDGRSDYVGFINRGIPAGGVFAGAEAHKTAAQVAKYGGVEGEQLDPCYHEDCDTYSTVTGQPPASTMESFPTNPVLAQQQADSLNGNALRSLEQFKNTLVHAVWYFARVKNAFPSEATAVNAKKAERSYQFKYQGHEARPLSGSIDRCPGVHAGAAARSAENRATLTQVPRPREGASLSGGAGARRRRSAGARTARRCTRPPSRGRAFGVRQADRVRGGRADRVSAVRAGGAGAGPGGRPGAAAAAHAPGRSGAPVQEPHSGCVPGNRPPCPCSCP